MDKLDLFRMLIVAVMILLLIWDTLIRFNRQGVLQWHHDLSLTGFLLWFATLFFNQNRHDGWSGQL